MTNKTPLQELIEHLEEIQKRAIGDSFYNGLNVGITKARHLLEKEKNIIMAAYDAGDFDATIVQQSVQDPPHDNSEDYFNQTFKP